MRTAIILGLIGLASAVSISVQDQGSAITPCQSDNMDCSCADKSFNECIEPQPTVSVHVNDLQECIMNCDLFSTFGQCEWMIFYKNGPDENCRLFAQGETMEEYLGSCTVVGQPLRYAGDAGICMMDNSPLCDNPVFCPGTPPCKACDINDECNDYHETQCSMKAQGTVTKIDDLSYDGCHAFCLGQSNSNPYTYFTWDRTAEACDCFEGGKCDSPTVPPQCGGSRTCLIEVVKAGFTMDQITTCKNEGIVAGDCASDADCAGALLCNLTGFPVCTEGCRQHTDCLDNEYCTCKSCPDPGIIGECRTGCRDMGDACVTSSGDAGNCDTGHICTTAGIPKLMSIGLKTTSCTGCNSRAAEGARLEIDLLRSPKASCTTGVLDNPGADYNPAGDEANFTEDLLEGCKLIDSNGAKDVTVSWEGAGSWTPEVVNIYWSGNMEFNCKNINSLGVSAGSSINLTCEMYIAPE